MMMLNSITKYKPKNIILLVVCITTIIFGVIFLFNYKDIEGNPALKARQEDKEIIDNVSKIYLIPAAEVPTIITISDANSVKDQAFFSESMVGDKVLIFKLAKEAVLYRPKINKIIQTAPITNVNNNDAKSPETTSSTF